MNKCECGMFVSLYPIHTCKESRSYYSCNCIYTPLQCKCSFRICATCVYMYMFCPICEEDWFDGISWQEYLLQKIIPQKYNLYRLFYIYKDIHWDCIILSKWKLYNNYICTIYTFCLNNHLSKDIYNIILSYILGNSIYVSPNISNFLKIIYFLNSKLKRI